MKFIAYARRRRQGYSPVAAYALSENTRFADKAVLVSIVGLCLWLITDSLPDLAVFLSSIGR